MIKEIPDWFKIDFTYFRGGEGYPRFTDDNTAEELLTTLLRELTSWCEMRYKHIALVNTWVNSDPSDS